MARIRRAGSRWVLGTLSLILFVLAGCDGNSGEEAGAHASRLTLQVATSEQPPRPSTLLAVSPGQLQQVEAILTRLVVSVTGDGLSTPVIADCPIPGPITEQCLGVTETADGSLASITLTVPKGNQRRITVTAFRGNQAVFVSTEDMNRNCILDTDEDTNNNGLLDAEITLDLIRETESVTIRLRDVTAPATPPDLENRAFIFEKGTAFELARELANAEMTLTVGTFSGNTAPFRLTSEDFIASGQVTITANATAALCNFEVESSTFPAGQGPSTLEKIPINPCDITVVDRRLVACKPVTITPAASSISDPPSGVVADLEVAMLDTPDPVLSGATVTYTVTVTNNGPSPATSITLTDPLPAGVTFIPPASSQGSCGATAGTVTCNLGTLAPDASATMTLGVIPTVTVPVTLTNTATVTGAEPDPDATNDSSTATTGVTPTPVVPADLAVAMLDAPDPVSQGETVTYTVTVTNNGPSAATGVTLTDPLPAGVTFNSSPGLSSPGCTVPVGPVTCAVGTLAPAASATVTISVTVTPSASTTRTNTVTVAGTQPDPNATNNSATVTTTVTTGGVRTADLAVSMQDTISSVSDVAVLTVVTYNITVTNNGPLPATGITLTDSPPTGVILSTPVARQGSCDATASPIICSLGTLAPAASATVTLSVSFTTGTFAAITNAVDVTGAEPDLTPANNSATVTTTLTTAADLAVTMTGPATGFPGQSVTYNVTVTNIGPSPATGVTLTDSLPANLALDSLRPSPGCNETAGRVTCTVGTLAPTASTTVAINYTVTSGATVSLTNTVTVSGDQFDPNPANNRATVPSLI